MGRFSDAVTCQWKALVTFARKDAAARAGRQAEAVKRAAAARRRTEAEVSAKEE